MSIEDRMTIEKRRKYLRRMQERYLQAERKERGRLLDETETVTDVHRKSLIRLMKSDLARQTHQRAQEGDLGYGRSKGRAESTLIWVTIRVEHRRTAAQPLTILPSASYISWRASADPGLLVVWRRFSLQGIQSATRIKSSLLSPSDQRQQGHTDGDAVGHLAEVGRAFVRVHLRGDLIHTRQGVQDRDARFGPIHHRHVDHVGAP